MYNVCLFYIERTFNIFSIKFRSSYELVSVEETDLTQKPVNMGDQTCQVVLLKGLLQVVCLIGLLMPMAYIYVFTQDYEPFHRNVYFHTEF